MRDPPEPFRRIVRELAVDSEFPKKGFWILNRRRGDCKAHAEDRQRSPVPQIGVNGARTHRRLAKGERKIQQERHGTKPREKQRIGTVKATRKNRMPGNAPKELPCAI